jgi:hypothetical protein
VVLLVHNAYTWPVHFRFVHIGETIAIAISLPRQVKTCLQIILLASVPQSPFFLIKSWMCAYAASAV